MLFEYTPFNKINCILQRNNRPIITEPIAIIRDFTTVKDILKSIQYGAIVFLIKVYDSNFFLNTVVIEVNIVFIDCIIASDFSNRNNVKNTAGCFCLSYRKILNMH